MSRPISLIVVEGALEVSAILKLLQALKIRTEGLVPVNKGGRINFWKDAPRYNRAAATLGLIVGLTDLESHPCPSGLIETHFPGGKHGDFVLRIAERTLESWLLGDSVAMAKFLKISEALVPRDPDAEQNPKQTLVNLARRSPSSVLQEDLVPESGSAGRRFPADSFQPHATGRDSRACVRPGEVRQTGRLQ